MKQVGLLRSVKFSLVGIAALFTFNSFAQSSSAKFELSPGTSAKHISSGALVNAQIYPGSTPTRFILITKNPYEERMSITLTGSSGKVYEKVTSKKNLRTIFDLSQVEDDRYTLTVRWKGNKFSKKLVLTTTYASAKNMQIQ